MRFREQREALLRLVVEKKAVKLGKLVVNTMSSRLERSNVLLCRTKRG